MSSIFPNMAYLEVYPPSQFDGSQEYMNLPFPTALSRTYPSRVTKSGGNSPRKSIRKDSGYRYGSNRRFSSQSDQFTASFYAALQRATEAEYLSASNDIMSYQSHNTMVLPAEKEPSIYTPSSTMFDEYVNWQSADTLGFTDPYQIDMDATSHPMHEYPLVQQPLSYQEPEHESDWPTYIPIVSPGPAYSEYNHSPTLHSPNNDAAFSNNTTALSSPEMSPYQRLPEPQTPPMFPSENGRTDGEILVGVGLYDEPENLPWEDNSAADSFGSGVVNNSLLECDRLPGKGLTLEETFDPPSEDSDDETEDEPVAE